MNAARIGSGSRCGFHTAEDGLLPVRYDVIARRPQAHKLPSAVTCTNLEMVIEAQGGIRTNVKLRVHSRIRDSHFCKRLQIRKRTVDMVRPVKCRTAGAQALLAVSYRRGSGKSGSKVNGWTRKLHMKVEVRITQPVCGCRPGVRGRGPHEINRCCDDGTKMRAEVVANARIQFVDLPGGVGSSAECHIGSDSSVVRHRGHGLGLRRCRRSEHSD